MGFVFLFAFLDRREGREKERERNINVWLLLECSPPGTWPATQVCALTGNRTNDPLIHRPALNPLSHTSQGTSVGFDKCIKPISTTTMPYTLVSLP